MSDARTDRRPHGSVELQATIYAAWSRVLFIGTAAAGAGHNLTIKDGKHPHLLGIKLQTIKVNENG